MTEISLLPHLNAFFNAASIIFLIIAFILIRNKKKRGHVIFILCSLFSSTLFLISYLYYHFNTEILKTFQGEGYSRVIYFIILISHSVLAVIVAPLIAATVWFAAKKEFKMHKRIACWTFPLWLYVSFTGIIVYVLLYQR